MNALCASCALAASLPPQHTGREHYDCFNCKHIWAVATIQLAHAFSCPMRLVLSSAQAASLLGLGLLYQGSCHRLMTETVLEEMCRTPGVNPHAGAGPGQDSSALTGVRLA